jgi:voltage-gated potassium channel Kch
VEELDEFLAPGSLIEVCVDAALTERAALEGVELVNAELRVSTTSGGPEQLLGFGEVEPFDQVIVLGYREGLTVDEADSQTLLSLLTLRKVWPSNAPRRVQMIAQLLDQTNVELAATTGVDDFIVSDALASLMLAQLSERAELQAVFDDLFDPDGAVLELRPAIVLGPDDQVLLISRRAT